MSEEVKNNEFTFDNPEYRQTYWHTCSHVMAQAVKRLWPEVKLAIGPSIDEGWYYDLEDVYKRQVIRFLGHGHHLITIIGLNHPISNRPTGHNFSWVMDMTPMRALRKAKGYSQVKMQMLTGIDPVSYTHLDVYKRQPQRRSPGCWTSRRPRSAPGSAGPGTD